MPSPSYTNADLARLRPRLGMQTESAAPVIPFSASNEDGAQEPSIEEILALAKATLSRADAFQASYEPNPEEQAAQDAALAISKASPSVLDTPEQRLGRLGSRAGQALLTSGKILAPFAIPEVALPVMAGQSALNLYRRGLQGVTEHPWLTAADVGSVGLGAGVGGRALAGLASTLSEEQAGARAATQAYQEAAPVRGTVEYAGERADVLQKGGLSRKQAMRKAGTEAGWPLGQSKATRVSHLSQLPEERPLNVPPSRVTGGPGGPVASSLQGLDEATSDPLMAFAGPEIPLGASQHLSPEVRDLFNRWVQARGPQPVTESQPFRINPTRRRYR